jgi:hypothetical protein
MDVTVSLMVDILICAAGSRATDHGVTSVASPAYATSAALSMTRLTATPTPAPRRDFEAANAWLHRAEV